MAHTELNVLSLRTLILFKNPIVYCPQSAKHYKFGKIDRVSKVSKNHISQNYEFKTLAKFTL